jgi:pimeloyl-ACP methyl ester carboxylesterase
LKIFSLSILCLFQLFFFNACTEKKNKDYPFIQKYQMSRKFIENENLRLSYLVRAGKGPTLVLIPGSFSDTSQWRDVLSHLDPQLGLILIEVRGHGKSWPPPENGTIEELANDVMTVTNCEKVDRFYVGGHSIGGMIAKEVGRRWPLRVAGVISIEGWTHWRVTKDAFNGDMYSTLSKEQDQKRLDSRKRGAGHWTKDQRDSFAQIWRKWEKGKEFISTTTLPVLELYGDRGKQKATREQLHLADRNNIIIQWINNSSHSLPLEEPGKVAHAITEFIERLEKQK